ncbi:MAG: hypothetical protein JNM68_05470 [Dinghuibacter sp.]|nr:hypothetical protein [Dinghuibacter sp.]
MVNYEEVSDELNEDVQETVEDGIEEQTPAGNLILKLLTLFTSIPVFLVVMVFGSRKGWLPANHWLLLFLSLLVFAVIISCVHAVVVQVKYLLLLLCFLGFVVLGINSIRGKNYGLGHLVTDYKVLVWRIMKNDPGQLTDLTGKLPEYFRHHRKMFESVMKSIEENNVRKGKPLVAASKKRMRK